MQRRPGRPFEIDLTRAPIARRTLLAGAASALVVAGQPRQSLAQTWKPDRPIQIYIGYPAGGAVDIVVRLVGEGVRRTSGAVIVGEIKSGAYGQIAAQAASIAPPDGYVLASAIMGMMSVLPALVGAKPALNVDTALTPVTNLAGTAMALVARPDAPFNDIDGLVAYAKSRNGEATYASSGPGSINHLGAAYINNELGLKMVHVPYRGGAPATMDIIAGRVDINVANVAEVAPMVAEGKMKALGVTSMRASAMMPNAVPLGQRFPNLDFTNWFGLAGPAHMPPEVVQRVAALFAAALREPETVKALAERGLEPMIISGPAFADQIKRDRARWERVARESNIRIE